MNGDAFVYVMLAPFFVAIFCMGCGLAFIAATGLRAVWRAR